MNSSHAALPALWLIYGASAALAVRLARRFAGGLSWKVGTVIAFLPLLFTGKAILLGEIYGPADLYYGGDPWKRIAAERGVSRIANPILSDLAFSYLPWRTAVREALTKGRFPFWNRFVLAGTPLLGTSQPGIFHPSTWLGILLPVPLSWTFSCTFTIFLALLCAYLFFRDFRLSPLSSLIGSVGWGFSTYLIFFNGYSSGPSVASLPLLLLGLRRIAARRGNGASLTVAGLLLSVVGGHPESFFHSVAAAGFYFLWELWGQRRGALRAAAVAIAAGLLAFLLAAPQLFPLLEAIPRSAEYRARRTAPSSKQSVGVGEAAARMLPAVLPFSHGVYGKSPVQAERADGSGVPLAYSGAILWPLAVEGLLRRNRLKNFLSSRERGAREEPSPPSERGRCIFLGFLVAGLLQGASAPGLMDVLTALPGFAIALNYQLVFLAALGLSGLAAFGAERIVRAENRRPAAAAVAIAVLLTAAFLLARGVFDERGLPRDFLLASFASEVGPLLLFAVCGFSLFRGRRLAAAALVLLAAQRWAEMEGTYPTIPASVLAPGLPTLAGLPPSSPFRIVATGDVFRPNASALYGLEDVRGYESLVLDRFADTFPLWCRPQHASFTRVDDLAPPFLSFLNVRFAIGPPGAVAPQGWVARANGSEMTLFENPRALPRAFVPKTIRYEPDAHKTLREMARAQDFSGRVWVEQAREPAEQSNGTALVELRASGPDLVVAVDAPTGALIATSLPAWPGWRARSANSYLGTVVVDHAFVGFFAPPGRSLVRLHYRPPSWTYSLVVGGAGLLLLAGVILLSRRAL